MLKPYEFLEKSTLKLLMNKIWKYNKTNVEFSEKNGKKVINRQKII